MGDGSRAEAPTAGTLVAEKYRVECVLAQSDQSMLLAAWDEVLERPVALKLLPSVREPQRVARFVREARVVAKIESDHVVRILDVGTLPSGWPFMVLERLDGCDLGGLLDRDGPMAPARIADLLLQACEGLAHAHVAGTVHRDIKPQNLFLASRADGTALVKVLDFGIAKRDSPSDDTDVTRTQQLLGSPSYMSPEQIQHAKTVDARSDIWSLGVVIYRLATGRAPFKGETLGALMDAILHRAVPPSTMLPELERIVMRCLDRNRDARYSNVLALARDLAVLAPSRGEQLVPRIAFLFGEREPGLRAAPTPAPAAMVSAAPARRTSRRAGLVVAACALATTLAVGVIVTARRAPVEPRAAAAATESAAEPTPPAAGAQPAASASQEATPAETPAPPSVARASSTRPPPPTPRSAKPPSPRASAEPAASVLPKVLGGRI